MRFEILPGSDAIVAVCHRLGTEQGVKNVRIRCERADGSAVGYASAHVITPDEIEVIIIPSSGVAVIVVEDADGTPDETDNFRAGQNLA